jgi:hypothetical protein
VDVYFAAATRAAQVLAALRAPYRGRSTPVNAWWGSFDLSVSLFSGLPAEPPSKDFIMRNSTFYAYAHPAPAQLATVTLSPAAARWDASLGLFLLDWDDIRTGPNPHEVALDFARSVVAHACAVCGWEPTLAASVEGAPPPVA